MTDLISRQAAIKAVDDLPNCYNGYSDTYDKAYIIGVLEELTAVPKDGCEYWDGESNFCALQRPADPVKHGKWLPHPTEADWDICSVCGIGTHRRFHYNEAVYGGYDVEESFAYCPNCGAKMDGGEE